MSTAPQVLSGPQMMVSNLACPMCDFAARQAGQPASATTALKARPGSMEMICDAGHSFTDRFQLESLQPRKIEGMVFQPIARPSSATGPIETLPVKVPPEVVTRLRARFGPTFDASVASILVTMCCDGAFVVPATERQTLNTRARKPINSVLDLLGFIDQVVQERDKLQEDIQVFKTAVVPVKPGDAAPRDLNALVLDEGLMQSLREKAHAAEQPLDKYVENVLSFGLSNGWF